MNQQMRLSRAIEYVIIAIAAVIFLAIWPVGLIQHTNISKSDEVVAMESEAVNVEHNLTQMFVAQEGELKAVDLYVCNDMQGETITFRLYDASYSELFNTFYVVKNNQQLPGFVHIPVGFNMVKDQEYYYTIEGLSTDLYVNLEDTYESTSIVNGILSYAGEEFPGYNVILRYEYQNPFAWWQVLLFAIAIFVVTTGLVMVIQKLFQKSFKDKEVSVQSVFQAVFNPIVAIGTIIALYLVFPGRKFGTGAVNYAFYGVSILMLAAFLLYEINYKRKTDNPLFTKEIIKESLPHWLQSVAFAMVLWYCFEYMNGLFDIHHAYSTCKILTWFLIAIITTYKKKELLKIFNLIWLIGGSVVAYFYAKPCIGIEEQGELHKLQAYVIVVGGFVIINMLFTIVALIRKKITCVKPNLIFAIPFLALIVLLIAFRNTRTWPVFILILCILWYFRVSVWEKAANLAKNLCNAIILNFIMMVVFSLCHRPYHYYIYYRYDMMYHTVTMTAVHLTLVLSALMVKVFIQYQKTHSVKAVLPQIFLCGMASCYMLFTLSRTGFLAVGLTIIALLVVVCFVMDIKGERLKKMGQRIAILAIAALYMFPITFTLTRCVPALVNDPVIYEIEPRVISITKGMPSNSEYYIDISRFIGVFKEKILGMGHDITGDGALLIPLQITSEDILLASTEETAVVSVSENTVSENTVSNDVEFEEDITNGRMEIYREYIKYWNLTGHDEMGVEFPDGSNSGHAHDVYLQVIHDHGLPVGIYFILFMGFAVFVSIKNLKDKKDKDVYQMLIPTLLIGFLAAGIPEWIFHPCNPFTMSILIAMAPLFYCGKIKKKE